MKKEEYLPILNRYHDIHKITLSVEGESLLTEEILNEIEGYSKFER
jgi:hypothetical protein